jgi:hypothetical protein
VPVGGWRVALPAGPCIQAHSLQRTVLPFCLISGLNPPNRSVPWPKSVEIMNGA